MSLSGSPPISSSLDPARLVAIAASLLGTPYQLGGRRAHHGLVNFGLDCSEYTAWVFEQFGITLPWNAYQQYQISTPVSTPNVGDLVFFRGTDPTDPAPITHVGLYVGGGKMLDAQDNGVQLADLSSPYWRQHFAGFGRVASTGAQSVPLDTTTLLSSGGQGGGAGWPLTRDTATRLLVGVLGIGLLIDAVLLLFAPQIEAGVRGAVRAGAVLA